MISQEKMTPTWKCPNCGWVHAEVPQEDAKATIMQAAVDSFVRHQNSRHAMSIYLTCWRKGCGTPSSAFVPAKPGDAPTLANLPPIVIPRKSGAPS